MTDIIDLYNSNDVDNITLVYNTATGAFFFYHGRISGGRYFNDLLDFTRYLFDEREMVRDFFSTLSRIIEQYVTEQSKYPEYS